MKRNYKREFASSLMSKEEIKNGISPYDCQNWEIRKKSIRDKEIKKMKEAEKKREAKKQLNLNKANKLK